MVFNITEKLSIMSDSTLIGLNENLLCKTTGWHFNCGLNCLTHFLYSKLEKDELQRLFENNKEYKNLLITFQDYYKLNELPTWNEIKSLLSNLETPTDREAIFAPVLRKHLANIMARKALALWETEGAAALSEYLATVLANDIAEPIIKSNQVFFDQIKIQYDNAFLNIENQKITPEEKEEAIAKIAIKNPGKNAIQTELNEIDIFDMVKFIRQNKIEDDFQVLAKDYWLKQGGCKNYVDYLADLNNSVMISADQLGLICQKLKIGVEIYTPDSIAAAKQDSNLALHTRGAQNIPIEGLPWAMKVHNNGAHWEYEEPDGKLKQKNKHNYFYPDAFYDNDVKLGKFKTYSNENQSQIKQIFEYVKNWWADKLEIVPSSPVDVLGTPSKSITPMATELKNLNEKQSLSVQTKFNKLHTASEKAMNVLIDKLENGLRNNKIDTIEKQMIFEFYFNAFEEEFKKSTTLSGAPDESKIKAILKEVHQGDMKMYKKNAIENGLTNFDRKAQEGVNVVQFKHKL